MEKRFRTTHENNENSNAAGEPADPLTTSPLEEADALSGHMDSMQAGTTPKDGFGFSTRFSHIRGRLSSYRTGETGRRPLSEQAVSAEIGRRALREAADNTRTA